ncbi:MAG: 60S ribosomal export protein NMD3 [Thermocladium sp.]|jgi:nonsense-mediated mRNA decay protein 3
MPSKVCPICGRETNTLIEGMCPTCYAERHRLIAVQGPIRLLVCKSCLSAYQKGRWVKDWRQVAQKAVQSSIKLSGSITNIGISLVGDPFGSVSAHVRARGRIHDALSETEEEAVVPLNIVLDLCPTCRYVYTEREAAVIQVRRVGRPIDNELRTALESVVRITLAKSDEVQRGAVIDAKEVEGGIDIRLTNTGIAKSIVMAIHKSFPSRVIQTEKIIGVKDGKHVSKLIFSVRIINLRKNDEVLIDGVKYRVKEVRSNSINLLDEHGKDITMGFDKLTKRKVIINQ